MFSHFDIAGSTVHLYNIFLMIAIVVASLLNEKYLEKYCTNKKKEVHLRLFIPCAVLVGLFGAYIMELITQGKSFDINNLKGGFTFYGGFLLAFIFLILYALVFRIKLLFIFNFYAPSMAIAHAIGRIGCFFGGCCYGAPTNSFLGVVYPEGSLPHTHYGCCALHPTQLYESVSLFIIFLLLNKIKFQYRFSVYVIIYAIARFIVELFRADSRGELLGSTLFSPSQLIALFFVLIGVVIFIIQKLKLKQK